LIYRPLSVDTDTILFKISVFTIIMKKLIPFAMLAALGCGKSEEPTYSAPTPASAKKTKESYTGRITQDYVTKLPNQARNSGGGWKDTHLYRVEIVTKEKGVRSFIILDFGDPEKYKELESIDEKYNTGDLVTITPTGMVVTLNDRVIFPEDLQKID